MTSMVNRFRKSAAWTCALTIGAMAFPAALAIVLLTSIDQAMIGTVSNMLQRESVLVFFFVGLVQVTLCVISFFPHGYVFLNVYIYLLYSEQQTSNLNTGTLFVAAVFALLAFMSGVSITRGLTAISTFFARLAALNVNRISASNLMPSPLRGEASQTFLMTAGGIGVDFAVVELIKYLPYPYNLILFLQYYRMVTVIVFWILPTALALLAVLVIWNTRKSALSEPVDENGAITSPQAQEDLRSHEVHSREYHPIPHF